MDIAGLLIWMNVLMNTQIAVYTSSSDDAYFKGKVSTDDQIMLFNITKHIANRTEQSTKLSTFM